MRPRYLDHPFSSEEMWLHRNPPLLRAWMLLFPACVVLKIDVECCNGWFSSRKLAVAGASSTAVFKKNSAAARL